MNRRQILISAVIFEGGLLAIAWILGLIFNLNPLSTIKLTGSVVGWGGLATVPLLAGLVVALRSGWAALRQIRQDIRVVVAQLFVECNPIDLLIISVFAGVGEEALFRGFLQPALARGGDLWLALIITNVAFGLAHPVSIPYIVMAGGVGLYLGFLQVIFGNILIPMVVHALYDFLALTYFVKGFRFLDPR